MIRRPWLGVGVSVLVHAALFALVVVSFSRDDGLPPLVVDLREGFVPEAASARGAGGGSADPAARPSVFRRWRSAKREATSPAPRAATSAAPGAREAPAPAPVAEAPRPEPTPAPKVDATPERPAIASAPVHSPPPPAAPAGAAGDAPHGSGEGRGDDRVAGSSTSGSGGATAGASDGPAAAVGGRAGQALALAAPGTGSGVGAEYGPYLMGLRQRIQQSVRYPASARRRGISGTVNVEILILPNGAVGGVQLLESSTHRVLDDAALDTIRSLPRVPLPPDLPARPLRVRVPVVFQIQ